MTTTKPAWHKDVPEDVKELAKDAVFQESTRAHILAEPVDPVRLASSAIMADRAKRSKRKHSYTVSLADEEATGLEGLAVEQQLKPWQVLLQGLRQALIHPVEAQCCMCGKKGLSTTEGDGGPECQLEDGRWTCSWECYERAVPRGDGTGPGVKRLVKQLRVEADLYSDERLELAGLLREAADALSRPPMLPAEAVPVRVRDKLRTDGWDVSVHYDYYLDGQARTFWLLTHSNGRWIKGEGATDAEALLRCLTAVSQPRTGDRENGQ